MDETTVKTPDGREVTVQHPEGATDEQILAYAKENYKPEPTAFDNTVDFVRSQAGMQPGNRLQQSYSPSHGAGGGELTLAGAGKSFADMGRGASQMLGNDVEIPESDKDLMRTGPGRVGNMAGYGAMAVPTAFIPGANTYMGSALIGGGFGALMPTEEGESRLANTATGAAFGLGGQFLGNRLANALRGPQRSFANTPPRNQLITESIDSGYTLPPSYAGGNTGSRLAEAVSGKYKTNQLAGIRNQNNTNRLAARALGLADDTPITENVLQDIRRQAVSTGYDPIRGVGRIPTDDIFQESLDRAGMSLKDMADDFPGLVDDQVDDLIKSVRNESFDSRSGLAAIKTLRSKASKFFRDGDYEAGRAARDVAEAVEEQIERHLDSLGGDGANLLDNFREARRLLAKSHSIEDSLNGVSNIDAVNLGRQLKRGSPLTEELEQIARFGQEFPDVAKVPKSGDANPLTILDIASGSFGAGGLLAGGPMSMALMGLPAARVGARYGVLSKPFQKRLAQGASGQLANALSGAPQTLTRSAATASLPAALSN